MNCSHLGEGLVQILLDQRNFSVLPFGTVLVTQATVDDLILSNLSFWKLRSILKLRSK